MHVAVVDIYVINLRDTWGEVALGKGIIMNQADVIGRARDRRGGAPRAAAAPRFDLAGEPQIVSRKEQRPSPSPDLVLPLILILSLPLPRHSPWTPQTSPQAPPGFPPKVCTAPPPCPARSRHTLTPMPQPSISLPPPCRTSSMSSPKLSRPPANKTPPATPAGLSFRAFCRSHATVAHSRSRARKVKCNQLPGQDKVACFPPCLPPC